MTRIVRYCGLSSIESTGTGPGAGAFGLGSVDPSAERRQTHEGARWRVLTQRSTIALGRGVYGASAIPCSEGRDVPLI